MNEADHGFFSDPTWVEINEECHDASGVVGDAAGLMYGYGAGTISGGNPFVEQTVQNVIDDFVTDNWGYTCDLPANIADTIGADRGAMPDATNGGASD